ncbi:MAG TPA: tetratricopeptide repeat protein [Candidatus Binatia bacterium]|jgi:Flp pilus assembly protein TadD|nr:tetratricopeptide repeat protein [Candidatus Binatia bacterium]
MLAAVAPLMLSAALLITGCDREASTQEMLAALPDGNAAGAVATGLQITYPQEGTLFPPDIVAPTFAWTDTTNLVDRWYVVVRDDTGTDLLKTTVETSSWRPSIDDWRRIKEQSRERDAEIVVAGTSEASPASVLSSGRVHIRTSKDPVNDSLFYREVPLPFLTAVRDPSKIRWRFGTVDSETGPPIVLQNLPVCGNCHSFADNGSSLGLDVDYGNDKGAYAIMDVSQHMVMNDAKIITWADFQRHDGEITFGLLSRMSPTGRYVVSTVKDRSVFVAIPDLMISQLFFPIKGILVVYDRETKNFAALPGADDPQYVQSNAVWSPDGKELVFARAKAYRPEKLDQQNAALVDEKDVPEFTIEKRPFRYDLYRIPFNDGRGGTAEAIAGASADGKSNFFPKYSPDGKWIVFCKANSYMLLQPDSELYIVPTAGGAARRLRYNTARMNSWHSWSSNSRWLVFSSKVNGPYTQLFLTHIDEEGNDSPPVLLERFTSSDRAANIPEFVRQPGDAIADIREEFLDAYSFLRAGMANEHTGDHVGAERSFRRGLDIAPDNAELRNALGWTLFQDGRSAEAVAEYERSLAGNGQQAKAHNNMALALVELGRLDDAATHFKASLAIEPKPEIYSDLGFVLARLGRSDDARQQYAAALAIDPNCPSAHFNMAVTAVQAGDLAEAEAHYRKALPGRPTAETHNGLGYVLAHQGRDDAAITEFREAIAIDPKFTPAYNNLAEALAREGKLEEAVRYYQASLAERPSVGVYNALGGVLRKLGRTDEANQQIDKARALAAHS